MNDLNEGLRYIFDNYPSMGAAKKRLSNFILENPVEVSFLSLKELAVAARVSEVTVIGYCRLLGYESFQDFREAFRTYLKKSHSLRKHVKKVIPSKKGTHGEDSLLRQFQWIQQENYENSVLQADPVQLQIAANLLLKAEQVYVLGHDASKIPADYLSHRLNFMKIRAWALQIGSGDSVQAMLAKLTSRDIVIFISLAPYHTPSKEIARFIQKKGAEIFVITDSLESPVVSDLSYNFICQAKSPLILNTMSSPISVIELMAAAVAIELGDRLRDFVKEFEDVNKYLNHQYDEQGEGV